MRAKFLKITELLGASPLGYQLCPSLLPAVSQSEPNGELTAPPRSPVGKVGDQLLITKINNHLIIEEPHVNMNRVVKPPFLAGRLRFQGSLSVSLSFKRNLPVFENNQFSNIKVIVNANDMRKNSLFSFTNFLKSQFWAQPEIYW